MANADPSGWTAGKIILAVVGGCFLLTALCCTGTYLTNKDEFDEVFSIAGDAMVMGKEFAEGAQRWEDGFTEEFGPNARWRVDSDGSDGLALAVGVEGGPDPADLEELQNKAWARWAKSFPEAAMPITGVGIGTAGELDLGAETEGTNQGEVHDWWGSVVDVDTLVERTGIAAPKTSEFFERLENLEQDQRDQGNDVTIDADPDGVKIEIEAGGGEGE